jgi:PleD family two-component response regulator
MSLKGKLVLIIDDSKDIRMRCRKILENLGMVVAEAGSNSTAFSYLKTKMPNLIILDLMMPDSSGFEFLSYRKTQKELSEVPVVVSSGLSDKDSIYKAIGLGANDYLLKPLNAISIGQKARKHIKDLDFKSIQFKSAEQPSITLQIDTQVTKL